MVHINGVGHLQTILPSQQVAGALQSDVGGAAQRLIAQRHDVPSSDWGEIISLFCDLLLNFSNGYRSGRMRKSGKKSEAVEEGLRPLCRQAHADHGRACAGAV